MRSGLKATAVRKEMSKCKNYFSVSELNYFTSKCKNYLTKKTCQISDWIFEMMALENGMSLTLKVWISLISEKV